MTCWRSFDVCAVCLEAWPCIRSLAWNTCGLMTRYRAIFAVPPRRWTFYGYGVVREHERWFA